MIKKASKIFSMNGGEKKVLTIFIMCTNWHNLTYWKAHTGVQNLNTE
jgi:hypothetical protein